MGLISAVYAMGGPKKKKNRPACKKKKKSQGKRKRTTRGNMPYAEYLQTDYWQKVREAKFQQVGRMCQMCGGTTCLQVHHKNYRHRGYELAHLNDLTVLCRKCHMRVHNAA